MVRYLTRLGVRLISPLLLGAMLGTGSCGGGTAQDESVGGLAGASGTGNVGGTGNFGFGCFEAGTAISTPTGQMAIERLAVGDLVLAYDEQARRVVQRPVTAIFEHVNHPTGTLSLEDGRRIRMTPNHPVFLPEQARYARADSIRQDQRLMTLTPSRRDATAVSPTTAIGAGYSVTGARTTVYNISVADHENYFAEGVLVHNKSGGTGPCNPTPPFANWECQPNAPCIEPSGATPAADAGNTDAGNADGDGGPVGSPIEDRALCSNASAGANHFVAFDVYGAPTSFYRKFRVYTNTQACAGNELGQIWSKEALGAEPSATSYCFGVHGSQLMSHLAVVAEQKSDLVENLRFVPSCGACQLELKVFDGCTLTGSGASSSCI